MTLTRGAVPDTPENRERLAREGAAYGEALKHQFANQRSFPCFLIARCGVIGWVTGSDALEAEYVIAQVSPRTFYTRIDKPRGEINFVTHYA